MWTLREGKVELGVNTPDVEPVGVAEHDRISVGAGDRYADQVTALNATARLDPDYPNAPRGLVFRKPPTLRVRWTV
jgi:hypothetical protein